MIKCKISLCAESVVTDSQTNNVSVFSIIEQIGGKGFPLLFRKLVYFFFLTRDKTNAEIQKGFLVLQLDSEELLRFPFQIDFQGKLRNRVILTIEGVVIPKPGTLSGILILRGKEYGRWGIPVEKSGKPKVEATEA